MQSKHTCHPGEDNTAPHGGLAGAWQAQPLRQISLHITDFRTLAI